MIPGDRNPEKQAEQQARQAVNNCAKDTLTLLIKEGGMSREAIGEELDYDEDFILQSLAVLINKGLVNLDTDMNYSVHSKAMPNLGIAK